jgi:uncharacterized OsmC-like protein
VNCKALHGLQFRATVEGHSFIADEGDEAGGHDAGPAPLRYFLAGIMMCHQVWCVKSAALFDIQLNRLEGEISGVVEARYDTIRRSRHTSLLGFRLGGVEHAHRSYDPA